MLINHVYSLASIQKILLGTVNANCSNVQTFMYRFTRDEEAISKANYKTDP